MGELLPADMCLRTIMGKVMQVEGFTKCYGGCRAERGKVVCSSWTDEGKKGWNNVLKGMS